MTPGMELPRYEEAALTIDIRDALAVADLEDHLAEVTLGSAGSWLDERLCLHPERREAVATALAWLTARKRIRRHQVYTNLLRVTDAPPANGGDR